VLFALVCIARQGRVAWRAWRGALPPVGTGIDGDRAA
jgi:hypothetical protein